MTMTRFQSGATAVGLLLAMSGPTFATHQTHHKWGTHRGAVKKSPGIVTHPSGSYWVPPFDYRRGTSSWPFGPGYNLPYPNRPYGDPGHW